MLRYTYDDLQGTERKILDWPERALTSDMPHIWKEVRTLATRLQGKPQIGFAQILCITKKVSTYF